MSERRGRPISANSVADILGPVSEDGPPPPPGRVSSLQGKLVPSRRKPTSEEAEAILTLVRGGWLRLELTLDENAY